MSTASSVDFQAHGSPTTRDGSAGGPLLICLPSMPTEATASLLALIGSTFPDATALVASPDQNTELAAANGRRQLVPYTQPRSGDDWLLTATDYVAAANLAAQRGVGGVLLLGMDAASLQPEGLRALQAALTAGADLALPQYRIAPDEGLVNSALLYPLTRALFGADVRFPLPLDAGLSPRMLNRLAQTAARTGPQPERAPLWPVAEASVAGYSVRQVDGGARQLAQPQETDFQELFPVVTSSLFADVETKATYWQRARALPAARPVTNRGSAALSADNVEEVRLLIENFRNAFNNLRELWSLVLPPQSLLQLKKLSLSTPESFLYPPSLWARTVYDFALAFHLRTLNRGHLLGSLTPLYLAWVASFFASGGQNPHIGGDLLQATAAAFEQEKPYLVSRWRWPDRFNP